MMRLDSLAVRLGLLFLAGFMALVLALGLIIFWPGGPGRPVFSLVSPEDAAAMAQALETTPSELHRVVLEALSVDTVVVRLEPTWPMEDAPADLRHAPRLERRFARYAEALEGRPFRVQTRRGAHVEMLRNGGLGAAAPVRLMVRLRTGEVLILERTSPAAVRRVVHRSTLLATVALAIFLLMTVAAMRQTARPIARLAADARRLAVDLATPDASERGAAEVKALARAFNEMKRRIRGLVDERTRILAAIAHDLRTYLTRLRLRAEFIADPDQRARAVADLEEMSLLLEDTLTFARESTAEGSRPSEVVEVGAELDEFVALRRELGQSVNLAPGAVAEARAVCSTLALRRMLANLTDNALRYAGAAEIAMRIDEAAVVIEVCDTGPGVPDEALARLTAPFERLEPSRARQTGGAGLGLAIVRALAESQGGALILQNQPEGGFRAAVRLATAKANRSSG